MSSDPRHYQKIVLHRLHLALHKNKDLLEQMNGIQYTSGIAWVARNLLEIYIWVGYCVRSEEHGLRFFQDGARDAIGSLELPEEMIKPHRREAFRAVKEDLRARSVEDKIADLTKFLGIKDAAKEVGFPTFGKWNMLLSKWAHPTALSVLGHSVGIRVNPLFYNLGIAGRIVL